MIGKHDKQLGTTTGITIGIAGPTGVGKTAAALAIAQRWPVEIISVDSALVFRGMNIGTAKPSATERASAVHHLIDILDPMQSYSAAQFVADARQIIADIHARGRIALLVGGTMLYFKALLDGLHDMPSANADLRRKLDEQAVELGWPAMHAHLAQVDPMTAARLSPNDSQRIQRALEVFHSSGKPMAAFHQAATLSDSLRFPLISLEPHDRLWLHQRLAARFDQMIENGLIEEVRALRARGDLHLGLPSMRCVGYRQTWEALDRHDFSKLPELGLIATRQLAKRQMTWLRSMIERQVIACDADDALAQVICTIDRLVDTKQRQTNRSPN